MKLSVLILRVWAGCLPGVALFSASVVNAAPQSVLFVDTQLSTASCTNYNPALRGCGSGTNLAYRAIAGAAAVASAGTTVLIRGGTYNERLSPANSGSAGKYITFKNYATEAVYLTGSPAMSLSDRSYLIVDGLHAENTTWLEARNAHYNIIQNCVFKHTPATGTTGNVRFISSNYNQILGNDIEDGNDNLLLIDSNFNLVQGNTIKEARHSIFGIRCGDFNLIRSNYFSNTEQKIGEVYDCGTDTTAVPNSFNSTHHNVIEGNTFAQASAYYSTSGGNGIQYAGQEGIIRRNVFYGCNVGLGMQVYSDEALYNVNNRVYNNVFYQNFGAGISLSPSAVNNIFKNNILLSNQGAVPDCNAVSAGQFVYRTPFAPTTRLENNAMLYQQPGQSVLEIEFNRGMSVAQFTNANPGLLSGTLEQNPLFVDAPGHNFHLQPTSPMVDAGAFLTSTASSGSGNVMAVQDATGFYDGFGIPWETGDVIQLRGQLQTARVVRVDYANNLLTLNQPLSWEKDQGVALQFSGGAPDVGAFELSTNVTRLPAPQNLRIVSFQ